MSVFGPPPATRPATLDDLEKVDQKAELIDGRIVRFMPTGHQPNRIAAESSVAWTITPRLQAVVWPSPTMGSAPKLPSGRASRFLRTLPSTWVRPSQPMKFLRCPDVRRRSPQ